EKPLCVLACEAAAERRSVIPDRDRWMPFLQCQAGCVPDSARSARPVAACVQQEQAASCPRPQRRAHSIQSMMQRDMASGYNVALNLRLRPEAEKSFRISNLPSPIESQTPAVDSLLKQFAQSSQLGANAAYIEDLYEQYLVSPDSVGPRWKAWFDSFGGREAGDIPHSPVAAAGAEAGRQATRAATAAGASDERERHIGRLITAYRSRGHLGAKLDPLALTPPMNPPDLGLPFHSLSENDLDGEFST